MLMIDSILRSIKSIDRLLEKLGRNELKLHCTEVDILKELANLLKVFELSTSLLQASKYPTRNILVLFHSELLMNLKVDDGDSVTQKELKQKMQDRFSYRFPLEDVSIAAALLDPQFRNLQVIVEYLQENGYTDKISFLKSMFQKHVRLTDMSQVESREPTTNVSEMPETIDAKRRKLHFSEIIADLAKKHSVPQTSTEELSSECGIYFSIKCSTSNEKHVLQFWNENKMLLPHLATLAQVVYCIPATSAPAEQVFSIAGLTVTAKRSQLSPNNVNKLVCIHNNYDFCKSKM